MADTSNEGGAKPQLTGGESDASASQTSTVAIAAAAPTSAPDTLGAGATTRVVPTASEPVRIPWGHWLAQVLSSNKTIIENVAAAGETAVLAEVPFGSLVSGFIGPQVVKEYVDQALTAVGSNLDSLSVDVPGSGVATIAANLVNKALPDVVSYLGNNAVSTWIETELSSRGIKI